MPLAPSRALSLSLSLHRFWGTTRREFWVTSRHLFSFSRLVFFLPFFFPQQQQQQQAASSNTPPRPRPPCRFLQHPSHSSCFIFSARSSEFLFFFFCFAQTTGPVNTRTHTTTIILLSRFLAGLFILRKRAPSHTSHDDTQNHQHHHQDHHFSHGHNQSQPRKNCEKKGEKFCAHPKKKAPFSTSPASSSSSSSPSPSPSFLP